MNRATVAAVAALASMAAPAAADSVFSSIGYGRWNHAVDVRSAALGDVSVTPGARWPFSPRNPAMLAGLSEASIYLSYGADFTKPDVGGESSTRSDGKLPLLAAAAPITRGIVFGVHLQELNDGRYHTTQSVAATPELPGYELRMKGSGAWTEAAAACAARFGSWRIGVELGLPFSSVEDEVTRDFTADGYADRTLITKTELEDALFTTFGLGYAKGPVSAGLFAELPQTGLIATSIELPGEDERTEYSIRIPEAYGIGASVDVTPALSLCGEFRRQPWASTELRGQPWELEAENLGITRAFSDVDAWGVGLEWRRGAAKERPSAWESVMVRAGFSTQPWNVTGPSGGKLTERSFTGGLGVPFARANGELGLALRYTMREEENSAFQENAFSLAFGVSIARQPRDY